MVGEENISGPEEPKEEPEKKPKEPEKKPKRKYKKKDDLKLGLFDLLWPILPLPFLPMKGCIWIAKRLRKTAHEERTDRASVQEDMLELQMRYEIGEIDDEEYAEMEAALVDRLEEIRKLQEEQEEEEYV